MTKNKKPHLNILTIGCAEDFRINLKEVFSKVLVSTGGENIDPTASSYDEYYADIVPNGIQKIDYETDNRSYTNIFYANHSDYLKTMFESTMQFDGFVLALKVGANFSYETRKQISLAKKICDKKMVVFLDTSNSIMEEDESLLDMLEMEIRELISSIGFSEYDTPIINGSIDAVIQGKDPEIGKNRILKLVNTLDSHIDAPIPDNEKDFFMPIQDVSVVNHDKIASGYIETGSVKLDDELEISGFGSTKKVNCTGIDNFGQRLSSSEAGNHVGLILGDIDHKTIQRGQVICKPNTVSLSDNFEAEIYVMSKDESGVDAKIVSNLRPNISLNEYINTASLTLLDGVNSISQSQSGAVNVRLLDSIAIKQFQRFRIFENNRTIAIGIITKML